MCTHVTYIPMHTHTHTHNCSVQEHMTLPSFMSCDERSQCAQVTQLRRVRVRTHSVKSHNMGSFSSLEVSGANNELVLKAKPTQVRTSLGRAFQTVSLDGTFFYLRDSELPSRASMGMLVLEPHASFYFQRCLGPCTSAHLTDSRGLCCF